MATLNVYSPNTNTSTVNLTFDDFLSNDYHPAVKKYEVFESPEDVIALSVAWKRLRDNGKSTTGKLLDKSIFDNITDADRETAKLIRDYYSKKFMMKTLTSNGNALSPFRKELFNIINSEGKLIAETGFGPVYYLPTFYEYDCNIDEVKSQVNIKQANDINTLYKMVVSDKVLTPLKRVEKKMKRTTTVEYWLKDNDNNSANVINITRDNPLLNVWDDIFNTSKVLKIGGGYELKRLDNFEYFIVHKWNLKKD